MNAIPLSVAPAAEHDLPAAADIRHHVQALPLNRLVPSPINVRRLNAALGVAALAESIAVHGLLQNLTVQKAKRGQYEVVAGCRRLAALRLLAQEGRLAGDAAIPCNVRDAGSGPELSLAENVQREPMHVADEILAFHELADQGLAPEAIASRFGQSVTTVRQRLKLAALSPRVLEVLRNDAMTIEQARALALSDSHAEQERVWFETPSYHRDPRSLRAILTREHVRCSDRLARFVGTEAYAAAGGGIVRDLFGEEAGTFLTDRPLLMRLASAALEEAATPLKSAAWKWVEASLEAYPSHGGGYGRIYPQVRDYTEDEEAELAALGEGFDDLQARLEDDADGDAVQEADAERLAALEQRITAIEDGARTYDPREMQVAGCLLSIDPFGVLQVGKGYVKAEDKAALNRLQRATDEAGHDAPAGSAAPAEKGYPAVLVEELTAIRTAALRVELAHRPAVALAALLYPLVGRMFHGGSTTMAAAVEVGGQHRELRPSIKEPGDVPALTAWQAMKDGWGDTLPGQPADLWRWLLDQPTDTLLTLLAFVTAANLNGVKTKYDPSKGRLANAEQVATAVSLDMRDHWTADAAFLSRLSKAGIADVLEDAGCPPQAVRAMEKAPKAQAVAEAATQLHGKGWLPALLRTAGVDASA